ncbi:Mitochondrial/chloroplast ribosomal protein L17 [Handroanthus impetiginosus]|uniref:Mitochondrial/chloroplast ribosomal protein L17 n=1 Tax=Handroanthus impetiginosus TaxID=429701 RepID=A0A2G9HSU5_9LAMI|nr:Mitochondrial/chloroplast ribosomal protein L17 [Handroanthus impetiginosus]
MTKFRKLNRPTGHRMSMLRTMVSQLVKHERIETTVAKAKEVRRLADNMVQLGKEVDRAGGYTRLLRTRIRVGDAAPMAYIEFIDRENELRQSKPPTPQPPQRVPLDPWTRSRLTRQFAPPKEEKSTDSDN